MFESGNGPWTCPTNPSFEQPTDNVYFNDMCKMLYWGGKKNLDIHEMSKQSRQQLLDENNTFTRRAIWLVQCDTSQDRDREARTRTQTNNTKIKRVKHHAHYRSSTYVWLGRCIYAGRDACLAFIVQLVVYLCLLFVTRCVLYRCASASR